MATGIATRATVEDLYRVEGKAELIGGKVVELMASGEHPTFAAEEIFVSLRSYARNRGKGYAKADGVGYLVSELPSGRESFQPDASFNNKPRPKRSTKFIKGAPTFAVEVRSEYDYGSAAEREMAEKRADYFLAGTLVVWDVDPVAQCVHVYRASQATKPTTYRLGETAEAEPAAPGWTMSVAEIFEQD
jgi:Uma2 family endonuclease